MIWSDILIAAFEGYVFISFFSHVFKRKHSIIYFVPAHAAFIAGMCLLRTLDANPLVFMLFSVASAFGFSLFYNATHKRRIFYACLITIFNMGAEIATGYILMIYQQPIGNIGTQNGQYIIGALMSKLVFLLIVRIVCRLHHRHDVTLPLMQCITVMLIPAVSIAAMHGLAVVAADCIIKAPLAAFLLLDGIMMINVIVFILYDFMSGQSARLLEHEKEKSHFNLEKQRYEALILQGREHSAIIHDTSKHLRILSSLADSGNMEDMSAYIKKLDKDAHDAYGEKIVPGYPAIDTVLRQKISEARSQGITVTHKIKLIPGIAIEPVDICVVLGNALDNAIEACARIETGQSIDIRMSFTKNRLVIVTANTSNPVEIKDGICETTKADKQAHGYGFSIMLRTIEKYRGNMVPQYENGIFTLHIMMVI